MLDNIDLQIIRIEGIDHAASDLSISIIVNNKQIQKIQPISNAHELNSINIPSVCNLQFIIKVLSRQEQIINSVTLQTQILPKEGYQWIPLCQCSNDFIYAFPKEMNPTKILVYVKSYQSLYAVQEITETSESEIDCSVIFHDETMPEIKFQESIDEKEETDKLAHFHLRIMELEQILEKER